MRVTVAALLCTVLGSSPTLAQSPECVGDCDSDGVVRIHELVRLVDAVLAAGCAIPEGCGVAEESQKWDFGSTGRSSWHQGCV
jgi:hypothetical protein